MFKGSKHHFSFENPPPSHFFIFFLRPHFRKNYPTNYQAKREIDTQTHIWNVFSLALHTLTSKPQALFGSPTSPLLLSLCRRLCGPLDQQFLMVTTTK